MKIPFEILESAIESEKCIGFCLACGSEHFNCEPDAREYICNECNAQMVYGAEEILIMEEYE